MRTTNPPKQLGPVRRAISFVCAMALLVGGVYWLGTVVLDMMGWVTNGYHGPPTTVRDVKIVLMIPVMMVIVGAFWLWEDF
jgi:uncharacterized membrane protein